MKKKSILFEQSDFLIKMYSDILEECGYEVFVTKEFDKAFEYFVTNDIDILWVKYERVDNNKQSGYEFIKKIHNEKKYNQVFKIVTGDFQILERKMTAMELVKLKVNEIVRVPTGSGYLREVVKRANQ